MSELSQRTFQLEIEVSSPDNGFGAFLCFTWGKTRVLTCKQASSMKVNIQMYLFLSYHDYF